MNSLVFCLLLESVRGASLGNVSDMDARRLSSYSRCDTSTSSSCGSICGWVGDGNFPGWCGRRRSPACTGSTMECGSKGCAVSGYRNYCCNKDTRTTRQCECSNSCDSGSAAKTHRRRRISCGSSYCSFSDCCETLPSCSISNCWGRYVERAIGVVGSPATQAAVPQRPAAMRLAMALTHALLTRRCQTLHLFVEALSAHAQSAAVQSPQHPQPQRLL